MCYDARMRISGGESKGRRIAPPPRSRSAGHSGVRPTSDKVREALFSILGERVKDAVFLELYAGTGAVGIEAVSRGAKRAVFVDNSPRSVRLIRENLERLSCRDRSAVAAKDALVFLRKTARELGPYDIVFADPPYHEALSRRGACPGMYKTGAPPSTTGGKGTFPPSPSMGEGGERVNIHVPEFLELLGSAELSDVLPEGALVAYEHFRKNPAPEHTGRLVKKKDYPYGDTVVSLYVVMEG